MTSMAEGGTLPRPEVPGGITANIVKPSPPEDEQMLAHMQHTVQVAVEQIDRLEVELGRQRRIHQAAAAAIERLDVPRSMEGVDF